MPVGRTEQDNEQKIPSISTSKQMTLEDNARHSDAGFLARSIGGWIHDHNTFTSSNPIGYTGYQMARSAAASVPYGLSMAGTWLGFQRLHELGARMAGVDVARIASGEAVITEAVGKGAKFGYRMSQFTGPGVMRTAAMVGGSFSLYRGTSKIGKWVNEYLFDPDDSKETTIEKVQHLPGEIWGKIGEVAPAEFNSTPVSAIVLGFIVASFKPPKALTEAIAAYPKEAGAAEKWQHFWKEIVRKPETKFFEQAAVNTIGYSLFFELGDRRFKDKQVSRGLWAGGSHSIGSNSKSNPSLVTETMTDEERIKATRENSHANDTLSVLTAEPSAIRFGLRRVLPTAVGITAYTAFKFRGAPLVLGKFTDGLKTAKDIPLHAWREGAATSLFFVVPWVTDKYAPRFDNLVNGLEEMVSGKKPDGAQVFPEDKAKRVDENLFELQQKLNAKELQRDNTASAAR